MASIDLGANSSNTTGGSSGGGGGGGSGTVTQVSSGPGLTGGPITTSGTLSVASVSLTNQVIGNLPVTNLATGSAASSSTFWRGDGVWAMPALGSGSSAGTVTQINTGAGLFGGPITSSGTIVVASVSLTNQVLGVLPIAFGGTNASAALNGSRFIISSAAGHVESVAVTASAPLRSDASGLPVAGSVSLTLDVTGNLPLSQTSGSLSLISQVVGNLPLSQTSGSISLVNQVSGNLPLSQTSGSISLVFQVSGVLPAANTAGLNALSGSVSLTTQVSGNLPVTNLATGSAASSSTFWRGDGLWAKPSTSGLLGSISLTTQVSGVLPVANGGTQWSSSSSAVYYNSGNVGIGTANPSSKLSFGANIGQFIALFENAGGANKYGIGEGGSGTGPDPNRVQIFTNGSEVLSVTAGANVGIGVVAPTMNLDVNGITGWEFGTTNQAAGFSGANRTVDQGGNVRVLSNTSAAADLGGSLSLGGYYSTTTNSIDFGSISGRKESGGGDGAGYLTLNTRVSGGSMAERLRISSTGAIKFNNYGAGTLTTDSSGNITAISDERLKDIQGDFKDSLDQIKLIQPIIYKWKQESGLEAENAYVGFSAQNLRTAVYGSVYSKKVFMDSNGKPTQVNGEDGTSKLSAAGDVPVALPNGISANETLSICDRAILAAVINALKDIDARLIKLGG